MIQRIQTIYLLLAGIMPAFTFCLPLARFTQGDQTCLLYGCHYNAAQMAEMAGRHPFGLAVLGLLALLLPLIAIGSFKNRKRQLRQTNWAVALQAGWLLTYAAYSLSVANRTAADFAPGIGLAFPLLAILFLLLAARGIRKDEALVRAADRIR